MSSAAACCHCGKDKLIADYEQAFNILVCSQCRAYEPLISKSNAKLRYLLSDSDLRDLGSLHKPNPQHRDWAPMRMYLLSQVESVAVAKHGSLDAIDQQRQQKVKQKIEERAKKRKSAEDSSQSEAAAHQQQLEAVLNKYSSKLSDQEEEFIDPADGKRKRRFGRGLAATDVEEL